MRTTPNQDWFIFSCLDFYSVAVRSLVQWPTELHLKTFGNNVVFPENIQTILYYYKNILWIAKVKK